MNRLLMVLALVFCSLAAALPSHAGEASTQADAFMRDGVAAGNRGEWKLARKLMLEAWQLKQVYDIAGNLGRVELELKMWEEAATHLHFAHAHFPVSVKAQHRKNITKQWLEVRAKVYQLNLQCNVNDASVAIAGQARGITPLERPIFLLPGAVEVVVRHPNRKSFTTQLTAIAGGSTSLKVALQPLGLTPAEGADGRMIAGLAFGGAALIGFGVGIAEMVIAAEHKDAGLALQSGPEHACKVPSAEHCADLIAEQQAHDSAQDVAVGGFVVGGVLAGASAGLLLWWAIDGDETESVNGAAMLFPMVDRHSAGLMMTGAW